MGIEISVFGSRVALAAILPYLLYTVLPTKHEPETYQGGSFVLQQLERGGMMACALMTALGTQLDGRWTERVVMLISVVLYDIVMIRYFAGGRDISLEIGLLLPRTALQLAIFAASAFALADGVMTKLLMMLAVGSMGNAVVKRRRMAACIKRRKAARRPVRRVPSARNSRAVAMSCDASRRQRRTTKKR